MTAVLQAITANCLSDTNFTNNRSDGQPGKVMCHSVNQMRLQHCVKWGQGLNCNAL